MSKPSSELVLAAARECMTPRQHEIWSLHVRQGWSFQKIGWHLCISKSTAFGHFRNAQERLVEELEERKAA